MKKVFLLLTISCFAWALLGQGYNTIGGVRFGTDWGITGKHRIKDRITVEGIFQSSRQREEVIISALVAKHNPLITKRFNFYTGGGLHFGINSEPLGETTVKNPFGVTAIAGVEFKIAKLILSWDFKPAINLVGGTTTIYPQTGVSLRYVFVKKPIFKEPLLKKPIFKKEKDKEKKEKKKINWKFWEKW